MANPLNAEMIGVAGGALASDLASSEPGKGAATVGIEGGGDVQMFVRSAGIVGLGGNDYFKVDSLSDEADALTNAQDGQKIVYGRKSFDRNAALVLPVKSLLYDADGAKFFMRANVTGVTARSGISGLFALSADYVPGSVELLVNVTSGVLSDYYARGKPLKIVSNAVDPSNRNEGTNANQWRVGEWALVYDIDDANKKLILAAPLKYWQGLDGQLNPPDAANRAVVESYTTANNARVFATASYGLTWIGGEIEYEDGHDATDGSSWTTAAFDLSGWHAPFIQGLTVSRGYGPGISADCFGAVLQDIRCSNLSDKSRIGGTSSNLGYGISDGGFGTTVIAPRMFDTRHGYTTKSSQVAAGDTNPQRLLSWGKTANCTVRDGLGGGQMEAVWDTHSDADSISFVDCVAQDGLGYGFQARGRSISFIRPRSNCHRGIRAFSEWQNDGGADLPALSGKGRANLTSCYIDSPTVRCEREGLSAMAAALLLEGRSYIEAGAHDALQATSGGLFDVLGGSHIIRINGLAEAADDAALRGIFTASAAAAEWGIAGPQGFKVRRGAKLEVDASAAVDGSSMRLFDMATGTSSEIAGDLAAVLNNDFDLVTNGGTLTIDQLAGWSISGTTATRETRSYFHTWPDGSISGCGRLNALADDGVTFVMLPVESGCVEINVLDAAGTASVSVAAIMSFADPASSTTERVALVAGNTTYVEVTANTDFSTPGTDGKLCLSYRDATDVAGTGRLYINNRLGAEISLNWALRIGNVQGA